MMIVTMRVTAIALLLGAPAVPAAAQTQMAMSRDAGSAYQQADAAMTRQWRRTFAYMKGRDAQDGTRGGGFGYGAALLASQRSWLRYGDAQCVIEGGQMAGGSAEPMVRAQCLARMTRNRERELGTMIWQ